MQVTKMNDFTNSIDAISQSFVGKTELVLKEGCECFQLLDPVRDIGLVLLLLRNDCTKDFGNSP